MKKHWLIVVALIIPIAIIWKIQFDRSLRRIERAPSSSDVLHTRDKLKYDLAILRQQISHQVATLKNLVNSSQPSVEILNKLASQIAGYATSTTTTSPVAPTTTVPRE